jgi:hypothetical protein
MTQPANRYEELSQLIYGSLEGSLDAVQAARLQSLISTQDWALKYYCEYITLYSDLKIPKDISVFSSSKEDVLDPGLWHRLQEEERNAPTVPDEKPEAVGVQDTKPEKVVRKISKTSLFSLYTAAAAIILIFVFAYFAPPATGFKVAVLSDSIHAKWADMDCAMEQGAPIFSSRGKLLLREGYAKLLFDNQTQVTIEGPAEFQVLAEDRIGLQYGKLYAIVPQAAIGFSVYTSNAGVIDLGTEFGVQADNRGDTLLYVMRGKTTLIAGEKSIKNNIEVTAGAAKRVSGSTQDVSNVTFRQELFVRDINSKNNVVWKGQMKIGLADIVGGGNGLGTGIIDAGIDPASGMQASVMLQERAASNQYHSVPSNPYIDGVFVPNGRTKQIVSSQGHVFQECPVSSGIYFNSIINTESVLDTQVSQDKTILDSLKTSRLVMHANVGITYDLKVMRTLLQGVKIVRFQSKFGIETGASRPAAINADFWILVDGKLKYKKTQVKEKKMFSVDLELSEKDRFLTLITTDGQDPEGRLVDNFIISPVDSDWCFFADPVLILE